MNLRIAVLVAALTSPLSAPALAQEGWAQIVLNNRTDSTANLYVDNGFGCGPVLSSLMCTAQVRVGFHTLEARTADGLTTQASVDMQQGEVQTWTIKNTWE